MAPYLIVNQFEHVSGLPEDRVSTTWPFEFVAGSAVAADFQALREQFWDFWYTGTGQAQTLETYLSPEVRGPVDGWNFKVYSLAGHLDGSPHGSPVFAATNPISPPAATQGLPGEVAFVLTTRASGWEAAPVEVADGADPGTAPDRPKSRLSGRVYLGPLQVLAATMEDDVCRPNGTFMSDVIIAGNRLFDDALAVGWRWSVWSRANAVLAPVTHIQIDDAFDTQRRRGVAATARVTFPVV